MTRWGHGATCVTITDGGGAATMSIIVFMTVPGGVLTLIVLVAIDRMGLWGHRTLRLPWRRDTDGRAVSAPGIDELHAIFYASKRHEIDQRRTTLMLRDEEGDGAPARGGIDLEAGTAVIIPPQNTQT
jgi:hypothetical protein